MSTPDEKAAALICDIEAIQNRIFQQLEDDPDNEVALAMFDADLRRAKVRLLQHESSNACAIRRYVSGKLVTAEDD